MAGWQQLRYVLRGMEIDSGGDNALSVHERDISKNKTQQKR